MKTCARVAVPLTLLLAAALTPPAQAAPAAVAPQNSCSGAFCTTFDLATNDALAPAQATTAAGQPTNLLLRFTDTSAAIATDKSTWLAKVSADLGSSSSKAMVVTDPAQLPPGSYIAGSAATAGSCGPGADGSAYATTCPAGSGSGHVELTPVVGSPEIKPATYGIQSVTSGLSGALTATISVYIPDVTLLGPLTTTTPVTYSAAKASAGPSLTMDARPAISPAGYLAAVFSLNTVALNLNGLVTDAAAGTVTPPVAFVRHSLECTSVTTTLVAHARGTPVAESQFPQTITGCPSVPTVASVAPAPAHPKAITFTMLAPSATVAGRTASLEWVFGDGSKAVTGAETTHSYPASEPVTASVTTVDSAGARSTPVQIHITAGALRGKQQEGDLIEGELSDQETGAGLAGQKVLAYRCATRKTPIADCKDIGAATTGANGRYRLHMPEVKKKGVVLVSHAGNATTSAGKPARFGSKRYIDVLPQPEVTLRISDEKVRPGSAVRLSGKVRPDKVGKTVRLQGFIHGKWRSLGNATITPRGTFRLTYVVNVANQTKLNVRAVVEGTPRTLRATSRIRTIHILR